MIADDTAGRRRRPFATTTALGVTAIVVGALVVHLPGFVHQLFDSDEGAIAGWRRRRWNSVDLRCVCTVAAVLLAASVVLGNALDYRENNRFRVEAAPFMLVLAAVGLEVLIRRLADRRRRSVPTTETPVPAASVPSR